MSLRIINVKNAQQESVTLVAGTSESLLGYAIADSTYVNHELSNRQRHVYFFPAVNVVAGDTIYVHSGSGKDRNEPHNNGYNSVHHFYDQGRDYIWNEKSDAAYLLKYSPVQRVEVAARRKA